MVADDLGRLAIADPLVVGGGRGREVTEAPHRVLLHQRDHLVDQLLFGGAVFEKLHLVVQPVERRVLVVRGVFAVAAGGCLGIRAVEHEQEVFRIRVVGQPAKEEDLDRALAHLVLEAVVVGRPHLELDRDLGELLGVPVEQCLGAWRRGLVVEIEHQRFAGRGVAPGRVTGLCQQQFRLVDRAAHRLAVRPLAVNHRVEGRRAVVAVTEQRRRQRPLRGQPLTAFEDRDVLFPVDRDRQRLAQLAVALGLPGRGALADHRVEPVEADVPVVGLDRGGQPDALFPELLLLLLVVAHLDDVAGAVVEPFDGGRIVITLQEFRVQRHAFLFDVEHHLLHERDGLAAIGQVALFLVAGLAFARIRLAAEIRVALQHMAPVLDELGQHIRPGADRPIVQRQVFLGHAGLGVELLGLPRHGRKKGHRQPVFELRVFTDHADAQRVPVERLRTGKGVVAEVQKRQVTVGRRKAAAQCLVGLDHPLAMLLQADDVVGHGRKRRRLDARRREAPDRIHIVVRGQFARAGFLEVADLVFVGHVLALERVVAVLPLRVFGQRRMRRKQDARPDLDVEHGLGDLVAGGVVGQFQALFVQVTRTCDVLRGAPDQLVRAFQVVVAVGRLVNLVGVGRFVVGVRTRRVEVLG